jgi:hypothetical protein
VQFRSAGIGNQPVELPKKKFGRIERLRGAAVRRAEVIRTATSTFSQVFFVDKKVVRIVAFVVWGFSVHGLCADTLPAHMEEKSSKIE